MVKTTLTAFSHICEDAPGFAVDGEKVTVITEPSKFYEELCTRSKAARKRIVLASLYLGTGPKEERLLECVEESLKDTSNNGEVEVKVLLDYSRGNRLAKGKSSKTMLAPLVQKYPNVSAYFYHTPVLRGLKKKLMPTKYAETMGVQHCKVYLFDDSLIISGANLSNDYFTDRQDRYVLICDCPKLADFFDGLVTQISEFSFRLASDGSTFEQSQNFQGGHPSSGRFEEFVKAANEKITSYMEKQLKENKIEELESVTADTVIFPSVQMGQLRVRHDSKLTQKFLSQVTSQGHNLKFATGYFNPTEEYLESILASAKDNNVEVDVIMAHPEANSFFNAPFPLYGIPFVYTDLAKRFYIAAEKASSDGRVRMYEYKRPGWTFHCKGLWVYENGKDMPFATMVGSPNFGYRSVEKDLEAQTTMFTRNRGLQEALHREQCRLFEISERFTRETFTRRERISPFWVKAIAGMARKFF